MDIRAYNRLAWDRNVERRNEWTIPVGAETITAARQGQWEIRLTSIKPVPRDWFPRLPECDVLCLASGGGQQGPILAAGGANVTVLDNSPKQLAQDRLVAARESLNLVTVEGDMANLAMFGRESFDLIVHPCSNMFIPAVRPVWHEAFRVLRPGGALLSGFFNPAFFIFDPFAADSGSLQVRHKLPYSDLTSLTDEERQRYTDQDEPLVFGHTLADLIGGQLDAGFRLTGFYEDDLPDSILSRYAPVLLATRALKP